MKVWADFNGVFGELLCLSHSDYSVDEAGNRVQLKAGMLLTAYQEDEEDGKRDDLLASGVVEPSPSWLAKEGSRWVLRIDENGIRHQSDVSNED